MNRLSALNRYHFEPADRNVYFLGPRSGWYIRTKFPLLSIPFGAVISYSPRISVMRICGGSQKRFYYVLLH